IQTFNILNNGVSPLSQDDRCQLNNVIVCYERESKANTQKYLNFLNSRMTLHDFVNNECGIYTAFISYFKSIPEFHQLYIEDQITLIRCNLRLLMPLGYLELNNFVEHPIPNDIMLPIHGKAFHTKMTNINKKFVIFVYNSTVIKLVLIILLFSTSLLTMDSMRLMNISIQNIKQLYESQNFYTELLWKYMLHTYGEPESIMMFNLIISQCLNLQNLTIERDEQLRKKTEFSTIVPLMQSVLQIPYQNFV
ncbi:unnamed protein product, partial [Didymodactylos carnosus]